MLLHQTKSSIPGPAPMPFLGWRGNVLNFARSPVQFVHKLHAQYGDIATVVHGSMQHIFVFSSDYNRQVLSDAQTYHVVDVPFPLPANSALARLFAIPGQTNGDKNKQQRHVMRAMMPKSLYTRYCQNLTALVDKTLHNWHRGQTIDLFSELIKLATATPCWAIFNIDPQQEGQNLVRLLDEWGTLLLSFSTRLLPFNIPGTAYARLLRLSEQLEAEYQRLIRQRRRQNLPEDDTLSALIRFHDQHPGQLNSAELIGQLNNFFNAGNTSRATIMTWTLFLLSQHPTIWQEVQQELQTVLQGEAPTLAQLPALVWLQNAIKESMRLLPPMTWFTRRVTQNTQLGNYAIPKDSLVMCSPAVTHRQPDIYPHPHDFKPERWFALKPKAYDYIPFGAGPRMCPGNDIAMLEMTFILARILQRYQLTPPAHSQINRAGMMLSAPKQMPMQVQPAGQLISVSPIAGNIHQWVNLSPINFLA